MQGDDMFQKTNRTLKGEAGLWSYGQELRIRFSGACFQVIEQFLVATVCWHCTKPPWLSMTNFTLTCWQTNQNIFSRIRDLKKNSSSLLTLEIVVISTESLGWGALRFFLVAGFVLGNVLSATHNISQRKRGLLHPTFANIAAFPTDFGFSSMCIIKSNVYSLTQTGRNKLLLLS